MLLRYHNNDIVTLIRIIYDWNKNRCKYVKAGMYLHPRILLDPLSIYGYKFILRSHLLPQKCSKYSGVLLPFNLKSRYIVSSSNLLKEKTISLLFSIDSISNPFKSISVFNKSFCPKVNGLQMLLSLFSSFLRENS